MIAPRTHKRKNIALLLLSFVVIALLVGSCSNATRPRDLKNAVLENSVLYFQSGELRVQALDSTNSQTLAAKARGSCVPYSISPDGSRVAYQDQQGAWLAVSTAGGAPLSITKQPVQVVSWLPSSQGVYFTDGVDIRAELFDPAKSEAVLKGAGQRYVAPTWSPNGDYIAFVENPRANVADVKLAKSDGTNVRTLGRILLTPFEVTELCPPQIVWSPDGSRFLLNPGRSAYIFYLAGGTPLPLPQHAEGAVYAWSPDGSQVAFFDGQGALWLVSSGGTGVRNVTEAASGPAWSPDGKLLAVVSVEKEGIALRVFDLANNTSKVLVQSADDALLSPQWTPTGDVILFTRQASDASSSIWVVPTTGNSGAVQIATGSSAILFQRPK